MQMDVLTGHYLMNRNGPLDIIKSPVAHKQTGSLSRLQTVAALHTQCNARHQLSGCSLLIAITSGYHFLSTDSSPACPICLCHTEDAFLITSRQRFAQLFWF